MKRATSTYRRDIQSMLQMEGKRELNIRSARELAKESVSVYS